MTSNLATCLCFLPAPWLTTLVLAASAPEPERAPHPLVWDAMEKRADANPEEGEAKFEFNVTNTSSESVQILQIAPSCGCTVAEMPGTPWVLEPGTKGSFSATVDYRGREGTFAKTLAVHTARGTQILRVVIAFPEPGEGRRARNQQLALADRQAVFRGDCASCHVLPAIGRMGGELFQTACAICHGAEARASMVPDLQVAREPRDAAYWHQWISEGKEGTLMPAFAGEHGGPLTAGQIASLVEYAVSRLPSGPSAD